MLQLFFKQHTNIWCFTVCLAYAYYAYSDVVEKGVTFFGPSATVLLYYTLLL